MEASRPVSPARQLLEDEVAQLSELPHSLWRPLVGASRTRVAEVGGRAYRIVVEASRDSARTDDVRVTVRLRPAGGLGLRGRASRTFVSSPDAGESSPPG